MAKSTLHKFKIEVEVSRDIGASKSRKVHAYACVAGKRSGVGAKYRASRCGLGIGRTASAATKKALRALASKV